MDSKTVDKGIGRKLKANEIIHAITNRRGPFSGDLIPEAEYFSPEQQGQLWTALRAGLFLDIETTEYYILLALSILKAHPDILDLFPNKALSFDVSDLHKYRTKMTGGSVFTAGTVVGKIKEYPDYFPIAYEYKISYRDADSLLIETDIGRDFKLNCKVFKKNNGSALVVDWDERLPFEGPLMSEDPWLAGASILVEYIPQSISYDKWIEYIESKVVITNVLQPVGFNTVYSLSRSSAEKIALLIMTLALQNTSIKSHG